MEGLEGANRRAVGVRERSSQRRSARKASSDEESSKSAMALGGSGWNANDSTHVRGGKYTRGKAYIGRRGVQKERAVEE